MRTETLDPRFDPRLQSAWKVQSSSELKKPATKKAVVIASYPDDEGVRLNNGRPGAAEGPAQILYYLGRMILPLDSPQIIVLSDRLTQLELAQRHEAAEKTAKRILDLGYRLITLGGGHDYGYPDGSAFLASGGRQILNVDAHLDVRPVVDGKLNSGTAFHRLVQRFKGKKLVQWGIQPQTNAVSQIQWAKKRGVKILNWDKAAPRLKGKIGLSICLDAFSGIRGVSAPSMVGLEARQGLHVVRQYARSSSWLGIYESSPRLDPVTEDSARLGALFAYHFIFSSK